jgi:hypothetical protein
VLGSQIVFSPSFKLLWAGIVSVRLILIVFRLAATSLVRDDR